MTEEKRECGTCSLCCKLVPVKVLDKPANTWCTHCKPNSAAPCTIYASKPEECSKWECLWRQGGPFLTRPDHARYVVDTVPTIVGINQVEYGAIQVWTDPMHPDKWRGAELQQLSAAAARQGLATLIRYGNGSSRLLIPPQISGEANWIDSGRRINDQPEPTAEEVDAVLRKRGA